MSDLKYKTLPQLLEEERSCEKYIASLGSKLSGQRERLKWIKTYIEQKQAEVKSKSKEQVLADIARRLERVEDEGFALIVVGDKETRAVGLYSDVDAVNMIGHLIKDRPIIKKFVIRKLMEER